jgi:hypothetical protein
MSDEAKECKAFEIVPIKRAGMCESVLAELGKRTHHQVRDEVAHSWTTWLMCAPRWRARW